MDRFNQSQNNLIIKIDSVKFLFLKFQDRGKKYKLDNDNRDLNFYAVEDGDTITVKLKKDELPKVTFFIR